MVKVLENRAVDLDIAPGVQDGGDLKNQADAVAYVGPRNPPSTPCSAATLQRQTGKNDC